MHRIAASPDIIMEVLVQAVQLYLEFWENAEPYEHYINGHMQPPEEFQHAYMMGIVALRMYQDLQLQNHSSL